MRIVVFGAGVQGTVFAVHLANAGHAVSLVARPERAAELECCGVVIQNAETLETSTRTLPVLRQLPADFVADVCLVTVRREQIDAVLPAIAAAQGIGRIVLLVNCGNGAEGLRERLGSSRTVLAFPGIAGHREGRMIRYVSIARQRTVVDRSAADILGLFRDAGLPVEPVRCMDAWLQRHAVFIAAVAGSLYKNGGDPLRLSQDREGVRGLILAVREGWAALDRRGTGKAPLALRMIFRGVPLWWSVSYWSGLFASPRGDLYFARHARHAPAEMAALAADVRGLLQPGEAPRLERLLVAIDAWSQEESPALSTAPGGTTADGFHGRDEELNPK